MHQKSSVSIASDFESVPFIDSREYPYQSSVVLSFDIEQHNRIEAAKGCSIRSELSAEYSIRMERITYGLLSVLSDRGVVASFFVLGQIAISHPRLLRAMISAGHEVASHGWSHKRLHHMDAEEFRQDLRLSKEALEQVTGKPVLGYRAPTFSIVRSTAWAIDILAEEGILYDSSIYPICHDRYGVPDAPCRPSLIIGGRNQLLELPPATLCLGRFRLPVGGGGYFRLLPGLLFRAAVRAARRARDPSPTVLYFHPWEFDPTQPRLPLKPLLKWRTYLGIRHSQRRLDQLLAMVDPQDYVRGVDLAKTLLSNHSHLPLFYLEPTKVRTELFGKMLGT